MFLTCCSRVQQQVQLSSSRRNKGRSTGLRQGGCMSWLHKIDTCLQLGPAPCPLCCSPAPPPQCYPVLPPPDTHWPPAPCRPPPPPCTADLRRRPHTFLAPPPPHSACPHPSPFRPNLRPPLLTHLPCAPLTADLCLLPSPQTSLTYTPLSLLTCASPAPHTYIPPSLLTCTSSPSHTL